MQLTVEPTRPPQKPTNRPTRTELGTFVAELYDALAALPVGTWATIDLEGRDPDRVRAKLYKRVTEGSQRRRGLSMFCTAGGRYAVAIVKRAGR